MPNIYPTSIDQSILSTILLAVLIAFYFTLRRALRNIQASRLEQLTTEEHVPITSPTSVNVRHAILEEREEFRRRPHSELSVALSDEDWDILDDL